MSEFIKTLKILNDIAQQEKRSTWDEYFMGVALLIASRSSFPKLHVGCVLVGTGINANRILSVGYNGFIPNGKHEIIEKDGHEQASIHAEQNAVIYAAKMGISLLGSIAYLTHYPCSACAKTLITAGISQIKYINIHKTDELSEKFFKESRILVSRFSL